MSMKNPLKPARIEPATFRIVAQHLNHSATAVPITNFKGNQKGSYISTNEDSEEIYVMNRFYYHYDDEYDKDNEEEGVNKEERRNESDENSDEIRAYGNNAKNEDYGDNDEQDDVSQ
jgi:hypothetical protein